MGLLTVARFKVLTVLPASWVERVEADTPGFTQASIDSWSDHITSRLRKRYPRAFGTDGKPVPGIIEKWLNHLVTLDVDMKRGVSPTDEQFDLIQKRAERALEEILEAANGQTGLFDLPTIDDGSISAIGAGAPLAYAEASPYSYTDVQARIGRQEDRNRGGGSNT